MKSKILIPLLLLVFYGIFLTHKINLVTADLGRHIRNGQVFFSNWSVLTTNFYSYTEPAFPTINHHWGAGVIFYMVWKGAGFVGPELLFIVLSLVTFYLFFKLAKERVGVGVASLVALLVIPLLAERTEIRPEVFSYFFGAVFFFLLVRFREEQLRFRTLFLLPVLQVLWVNTHIYFFFGPLLVGLFLLENLWHDRRKIRPLLIIFALTLAACLVNPFGPKGLFAPLEIFRQYGYSLVENQPVWFLEKVLHNPNYLIFKIVFVLLVASTLAAAVKKPRQILVSHAILTVGLSLAAWFAVRNFALFGFFSLYIIAANLTQILANTKVQLREKFNILALASVAIVTVIAASGNVAHFFPYWHTFGLGLERGNGAAAEFFKRERMHGPIFNDYDNGGYLIYHLYPQEKVFVDNRPEAYSVSFFKDSYVPMQEQEDKWVAESSRYNFNVIFFNVNDLTPWAQHFLRNRIKDNTWAPVFVDQYSIIFLKRSEQNRAIIEKFEIPREKFGIVKTEVSRRGLPKPLGYPKLCAKSF